MHTILALDASSTSIGWVLWDGSRALAHGTLILKGDLVQRIGLADTLLRALLAKQAPDVVAIEAPAYSRTQELVAQQRVAGVALLVILRAGLLHVEISPTTAKKTLTGSGRANKIQMIVAAADYLYGDYTEHTADALGIAMSAHPQVQVEGLVAA